MASIEYGKEQIPVASLKVYITSGLYARVRDLPESTFTASNGIKIKCNDKFKPGFSDGAILFDDSTHSHPITLSGMDHSETYTQALTEVGALTPSLDGSWKTFGTFEPMGVAFKKELVVQEVEYLLIPANIYEWLENHSIFVANNGLKIVIGKQSKFKCSQKRGGPVTCKLFLDASFKGKKRFLNTEFENRTQFVNHIGVIQDALKQLSFISHAAPALPPTTLTLSKKGYLYAHSDEGFKASNGQIIRCCGALNSGYGNGEEGVLFLDSAFDGTPVLVSGSNFRNYAKLCDNKPAILAALAELEAKAKDIDQDVLERLSHKHSSAKTMAMFMALMGGMPQ